MNGRIGRGLRGRETARRTTARVALERGCGIVGPMKRWWSMGLLWLVGGFGAIPTGAAAGGLRASTAEVRKGVVAVIEGQLAAFRAGDPKTAYTYAAATLRAQNPVRQFLRIVETNYPEIWANTRGEFGVVRDDGTRATVLVQVFSPDGRADYDYGLVKERDGAWRIDRVLRHAPKKADKV